MSIKVLEKILAELGIKLTELEKDSAYSELVDYFGIAGSVDLDSECKALEQAWLTPEYREIIEEYLRRLKKRKKRKSEILVEEQY